MGAAPILQDLCGVAEVATETRRREVEFARVAVADTADGRVALALERRQRLSSADGWKILRSAHHDLSPLQARHLAQLLLAAADRAERRGG